MDIALLMRSDLATATIKGWKSQTRRMMKPQPVGFHNGQPCSRIVRERDDSVSDFTAIKCPHGGSGDRLWVREPVLLCKGSSEKANQQDATYACFRDGSQKFRESGQYTHWDKPVTGAWPSWARWTPSIHMPRWASRLTLDVAAIRWERLNDISEADAFAEGVSRSDGTRPPFDVTGMSTLTPYRDLFADKWEEINGRGSWLLNPYVWVISFRRIDG